MVMRNPVPTSVPLSFLLPQKVMSMKAIHAANIISKTMVCVGEPAATLAGGTLSQKNAVANHANPAMNFNGQ